MKDLVEEYPGVDIVKAMDSIVRKLESEERETISPELKAFRETWRYAEMEDMQSGDSDPDPDSSGKG